MKDKTCAYCMRGEYDELLEQFGIYICDLSVSSLILFKEQSHPGRCIVAYRDHVSEIVNLSDDERNAFFSDVNRAAKAIHSAFHPDKINYGAYGDTGCHLHVHLVPKYKAPRSQGAFVYCRYFFRVSRTAPGPLNNSLNIPVTFSARPTSSRLTPNKFLLASIGASTLSTLSYSPRLSDPNAA